MRSNGKRVYAVRNLIFAVVCVLLICIWKSGSMATLFAASAEDAKTEMNADLSSADEETSYEIYIDDQSGILEEAQVESLRQFMEPITRFCNVAFLSTDTVDMTTEEYSQAFEDTHWIGQPQISVLFDMGYRELIFNADPVITKTITAKVGDLIMDETLPHAAVGEYYLCARDNYIYINALLEGKTIPEGRDLVAEVEASLVQTRYEQTETGYELIIEDYAELLTAEEKDQLLEVMRPIGQYGNVAMVSVNDTEKTTEEYASDYVYDHWHNGPAALLLIDMQNRYIRVETDEAIRDVVDETYAYTITDNIYSFASEKDYYGCAEEAFTEILSLLEGQHIAQPLKYISNALLSIIASIVLMFIVVSVLVRRKAPAMETLAAYLEHSVTITKMERKKRRVPTSSGSSGGSGWFSGGSSGSSSGWSSGSSGGGSWSSSGSSGGHSSSGGQHRF